MMLNQSDSYLLHKQVFVFGRLRNIRFIYLLKLTHWCAMHDSGCLISNFPMVPINTFSPVPINHLLKCGPNKTLTLRSQYTTYSNVPISLWKLINLHGPIKPIKVLSLSFALHIIIGTTSVTVENGIEHLLLMFLFFRDLYIAKLA